MSSCSKRGQVSLFRTKTCLLVRQEDMSSCSTRRHTFLFNSLQGVEQEDMSSCSTRGCVFLSNRGTGLLVEQEDMSSRGARRHVSC